MNKDIRQIYKDVLVLERSIRVWKSEDGVFFIKTFNPRGLPNMIGTNDPHYYKLQPKFHIPTIIPDILRD